MAKRDPSTASARRALVAELIGLQNRDHESADMVVLLERLCRAAVHNLGVVGAAVNLMSDAGTAGVVAAADERSTRIDELQFTLGEGPCHDAFDLRRPVLTADLQSHGGDRWPGYRVAAQSEGIRGVFAFPLHVGASAFGVLSFFAQEPGSLPFRQLSMALTFAEVATEVLLNEQGGLKDDGLHLGVETVLNYRSEIYQAQGTVMVQLGVSLAEALVRMRAHAFANEVSLVELASGIMAGAIILDRGGDE